MVNKKHTILLLLAFFMFQLAGVLQAKEAVDFTGSRFSVSKGASVQIGESASITVSNLITEADITGKGKLILLSNNNTFIDANNHSIENLVLTSANKVELLSNLRIVNELIIQNGELHLNDFNLLTGHNTKFDETTLLKIIQNGKGKLLQGEIPLFHDAAPFVVSAPLHFDFSQIPAFTVSDSREADENIFYYTIYFFPERTNDVPVPPPKA